MDNVFTTTLPVSIEHINYGNHLAHDKLISMMHEARLRFFDSLQQSEFDFWGVSLILKSMSVNYHKEVFRGDNLSFHLSISEIRRSSFTLRYSICDASATIVADAEMVLVGFNYNKRNVTRLPDTCREVLTKAIQ